MSKAAHIHKLEVAKTLMERRDGRLSRIDLTAVAALIPDWDIETRFTLGRGETIGGATVEATRQISVPKTERQEDESWYFVRMGLLQFSGKIAQDVRNVFRFAYDDVASEAVNLAKLSTPDCDVHRLTITATNANAFEVPQLTTGFVGGLITVDFILAKYGVAVPEFVDVSVVTPLLQEPYSA